MRATCWRCEGVLQAEDEFQPAKRFCAKCEAIEQAEQNQTVIEHLRLRALVMHNRALRVMEDAGTDMSAYREAAVIIREKALMNVDNFASSDEMIAAMVLIENRIQTQMQYQIGKYRADFLLPGLKAVLEIDGGLHVHSRKADANRDVDIRRILGANWEVIRIPTDLLREKPDMLVEAIVALKAARQKARNLNGGNLPAGFSRARDEAFRKILQGRSYNNENDRRNEGKETGIR